MNPLRLLWLVLLSLALALGASAASAQQLQPVPPLQGHVNDNAAMLTPQQRAQLEQVLTEYEQQTGSQIAVLTVATTEPEPIEQYSIRVTDAWKLGRKGVDDGVLLLVAKDNPPGLRRLRIEAGRGVQGSLTDAQSKRILQDVIAPHFKQNQYYDGMVAGVSAIATLLNKEQLPGMQGQPQADQGQAQARGGDGGGFSPFWLIGLFFLFMLFRPRRSRIRRGGWGSGATGFILGNAIGSIMSSRGGGGWGGG
ncbi:YgcG family protein, partial [Massilia arenosa]